MSDWLYAAGFYTTKIQVAFDGRNSWFYYTFLLGIPEEI
jgi:hypothetical protein